MITLDGVMQAPGGPKEDLSGGFKYGGWVAPYGDKVSGRIVQEELNQRSDYLLGRKTFEIWAPYWPEHDDFWPGINEGAKYVFSKKLKKSAPLVTGWNNTHVIRSAADIIKLKKTKGPDIQVWGSSMLVQLLLKNDLVESLKLKIYPLILGKGKKLFSGGAIPASFKLISNIATTEGVIIAHYRRSGSVKTGTIGA